MCFLAGVVLSWGGCTGKCFPFLFPYIICTKKTSKEGVKVWFWFWWGKLFAYLFLGLALGLIGEKLIYASYLRHTFVLGGISIALLGTALFFRKPNFSCRCSIFSSYLERLLLKGDKGVFIAGFFLSLFPCLPLIGLFSYLALVIRYWWEGPIYLFFFALGSFFSPLFLLSFFLPHLSKPFLANQRLYLIFQRICALIIFSLGMKITFGSMGR